MKLFRSGLLKVAKITAEKVLKRDANCTTTLYFYQPKVPANLKRFKNHKI